MDGENGIKVRTTRRCSTAATWTTWSSTATPLSTSTIRSWSRPGADPDLPRQRWAERLQHLPRRRRHLRPGLRQRQPAQRALACSRGRSDLAMGPASNSPGRARDLPGRQPRLRTRGPRRNRPAAGRVVRSQARWGDSTANARIAHRCQRVEEQSRVPYLAGQKWMVRPSRDDPAPATGSPGGGCAGACPGRSDTSCWDP